MASRLRISSHVRSVIDPDGAVVLDLRGDKYYSLNGVGAEIWIKLEAGVPVTEIEAQLGGIYNVPVDTVAEDVAGFIEQLRDKRLIDVDA